MPADPSVLLLQLARAAFWAAAGVAAFALAFAPRGHETLLLAIVGAACALAFGLWRAALHARRRRGVVAGALPEPVQASADALRDAASALQQAAHAAPDFEAALHAVARLLRSEFGARDVRVHAVDAVGDAALDAEIDTASGAPQASLRELIAAEPGFRALARRVRLDALPLGAAIARRRGVGVPPGPMALPVLCGERVVALLEFAGIEVAADPDAFASVLEAARLALGERACASAARRRVPPETQFATVAGPAQALDGPVPPGRPGTDPQEFDGCHCEPIDAGAPLAMLNAPVPMPVPLPLPAAPAAIELDPAALARLRELDPSGATKLLERVLTAFRTSAARLRPQLAAARAGGDRAVIRRVAHTLKSSAASIGALPLSQLCARVEAALRDAAPAPLDPSLDPDLDALEIALDATLAAITLRLEPKA